MVGDIKFNRGRGRVCRSVYVGFCFHTWYTYAHAGRAAETFDAIVKTNTLIFLLVVVGDLDRGAMRMFVYWFLDRYSEGSLRGITIYGSSAMGEWVFSSKQSRL